MVRPDLDQIHHVRVESIENFPRQPGAPAFRTPVSSRGDTEVVASDGLQIPAITGIGPPYSQTDMTLRLPVVLEGAAGNDDQAEVRARTSGLPPLARRPCIVRKRSINPELPGKCPVN